MPLCSPNEFIEFQKSNLWKDLVKELDVRIELRRLEMEDPDSMLTIDELRQAQGGIKAYREMRDNLLDSLIQMSSETKGSE
jgi:hypothetical protein